MKPIRSKELKSEDPKFQVEIAGAKLNNGDPSREILLQLYRLAPLLTPIYDDFIDIEKVK